MNEMRDLDNGERCIRCSCGEFDVRFPFDASIDEMRSLVREHVQGTTTEPYPTFNQAGRELIVKYKADSVLLNKICYRMATALGLVTPPEDVVADAEALVDDLIAAHEMSVAQNIRAEALKIAVQAYPPPNSEATRHFLYSLADAYAVYITSGIHGVASRTFVTSDVSQPRHVVHVLGNGSAWCDASCVDNPHDHLGAYVDADR